MNELDVTRTGLDELGAGATNALLVAYAAERHGAKLDPRFVSLYRATLNGLTQQRLARESAAKMVDEARQKERRK
jgi:hypothetical protein